MRSNTLPAMAAVVVGCILLAVLLGRALPERETPEALPAPTETTAPVDNAVPDEVVPPRKADAPKRDETELPAGVPAKVGKVLKYVDEHGKALAGYEGGRTFLNAEKHLPRKDADDKPIKYREWDVNPHRPGVNRGAERLVTGSDGSAYYTNDHYRSFKKIR